MWNIILALNPPYLIRNPLEEVQGRAGLKGGRGTTRCPFTTQRWLTAQLTPCAQHMNPLFQPSYRLLLNDTRSHC